MARKKKRRSALVVLNGIVMPITTPIDMSNLLSPPPPLVGVIEEISNTKRDS